MNITGNLLKMESKLTATVSYSLPVGKEHIEINKLIGVGISLTYKGVIHCIACGRKTSKSFFQGYCYPCFTSLPDTDECILYPEKCRAHEGVSRDMEWSERHCLQDHIVYLAVSGGLKVGVTRHTQIPTRWIDQGAVKTIVFARTPNRYTAGRIEVALKAHVSDKTNWRNMLTNKIDDSIDLVSEKNNLSLILSDDFRPYLCSDNKITEINYPVSGFPAKVKSIGFDNTSSVSGILTGIKGQYLIFGDGSVLNIRKHNGYMVTLRTETGTEQGCLF